MGLRRILGLGACALALASCGEKPAGQPATAEPALTSVAGIVLSDARLQLPVVQGRPGVAYFTIGQTSGAARTVAAVSVEMVGKTEMHQTMTGGSMSSMKPLKTVALGPGTTVKFEPGGNHVMLFDLDPKLRFQDSVKLTVELDDGSKAEAKASVTTAGDGLENMP
jgi:copper(I)-binding protein